MAVNTPTGNSCGAIKLRAKVSASSKSTPPIKLDKTTNLPCVVLTIDRTTCGAAKPTKAIKPVCATAVPVASAMTATKTMRMVLSGKPRLNAVSSPKDKPSKTCANNHDNNIAIAKTEPITLQAPQPTKLVEPKVNDCMAAKI